MWLAATILDCADLNHKTNTIQRIGCTHLNFVANFNASLVAQMVKNLSAMQETCVQSLDQEDPLEKEMATHSSILAWRTPWTEKPRGLQSMESQKVGHD